MTYNGHAELPQRREHLNRSQKVRGRFHVNGKAADVHWTGRNPSDGRLGIA